MPLSRDTSPEIERRQIDGWRRMSDTDRAATVAAMTTAVFQLAAAGVRHRFPAAPPDIQRRHLAEVVLGRDLASRAFPR